MKKTELIKNAINQRVFIEDLDGVVCEGWLVVEDIGLANCYLLLPFNAYGTDNIRSFRVSHIKHLAYIGNGCVLW